MYLKTSSDFGASDRLALSFFISASFLKRKKFKQDDVFEIYTISTFSLLMKSCTQKNKKHNEV